MLCFLVFFPLLMGAILSRIKTEASLWRLSLLSTAILSAVSFVATMCAVPTETLPLFSDFGISFSMTVMGGLYAILSSLLWLVAVMVGRPLICAHHSRYYTALLVTLGGVMGVFLATDLFTLFVFFEVMSFTSYLWVIHQQDTAALTAGSSYLSFSVFGGLSLLFGLFLLYGLTPNLTIAQLTDSFAPHVGSTQLTVGCAFLFLGFGAKAGAFFLNDWLPVSYVAAPAPASALLSGILSKAGVYGLLLIAVKILAGWTPFVLFLLLIALLNMVLGGLCALSTSNMKRMLAFSSISQIGFMLWGIALCALLGEHGAIAAYGTVFHMVNHTLIKVLLFSLSGVVLVSAGTLDLNKLQGFGRGKPLFHALFLAGVLAVTGIPGLSGYVSKTLLHEAIVEYLHLSHGGELLLALEYLFLFAGGCTLAYMLKLYICLFWEGDKASTTPTAKVPLILAPLALALVGLGALPHLTFDALGHSIAPLFSLHAMEPVAYFSLVNLRGSLLSILMGLALFGLQRMAMRHSDPQPYRELTSPRDTLEYRIYRPGATALSFFGGIVARIFDVLLDTGIFILSRILFTPLTIPASFYHGDDLSLKLKRPEIHLTFSLAYSLLMFGLGFLFTVISLLVLAGRGA